MTERASSRLTAKEVHLRRTGDHGQADPGDSERRYITKDTARLVAAAMNLAAAVLRIAGH